MATNHTNPARPFLPLCAALSAGILGAIAPVASADPTVIDAFDDLAAWTADAPEGVEVSAHLDPDGEAGSSLRIDYDFITGGGYCVVRREVDLALPENYRFSFDVRGDGQPNNLEFKIVGPSSDKGEDVWWVNRRAFDPPRDWTHLADKRRSFEFAWGPSGGEPLDRVVAIEIAIAMAEGGKGSIWLDNLAFEELPAPRPYTATPTVAASDDGFLIEFHQLRDFGGVVLRWADDSSPRSYTLESSEDNQTWTTLADVHAARGPIDHHLTPDGSASALRIRWAGATPTGGLASFDVLPLETGDDPNAFLSTVAADSPRGWFPKQFTGAQAFWTVVGAPNSDHEGLLSEFGAYETYKGGPSLEPFLLTESGSLITWADADISCALLDGYIPIPTVRWAHDGLTMDVTPVHPSDPPRSEDAPRIGLIRYRITNTTAEQRIGRLALALRPWQVLPPWQRLNLAGGFARLDHIRFQQRTLICNDAIGIAEALTPPDARFATRSVNGDAVRRLASGDLPKSTTVSDDLGMASAAFCWDFRLDPGATADIIVRVPTHRIVGATRPEPRFATDWGQYFQFILDREAQVWRDQLNRVSLAAPPEAAHMWNTVRANLGYILINADGPAIHPGSRTYERSWIRDGSLTGTAMLNLGQGERVIEFLRWYSDHLYDNGKVPCVVDQRGPDPYPEHDSPGQYIYLLLRTALVTGDTQLARDLYPKALAAVGYIEALRAERMTPEYADPTSDLHRFYGILPESGSHEGYMNKPMHSFWDDFFCLRGLEDIVRLAQLVGDTASVPRLSALRDDFRACFAAAIRSAIDDHAIDYIPGCVELGDFDATSTAIGISPCGEVDWMPVPETRQTFDKYWKVIEGRSADSIPWHDYTPYETRIIGALVLLGEPARAHELMRWLFLDQLPKGWHHWAEVAYRQDDFPGWIGDMPHTWVGSGFINSVRTMFLFERQTDQSLVVGLGIPMEWIASRDGIAGNHWPTEFGVAAFRAHAASGALILEASVEHAPPGGIVFHVPGDASLTSAKAVRGTLESVTGREIRVRGTDCRVEVTLE